MKIKLLILLLFVFPALTQAQVLLTEDFDYGTTANADFTTTNTNWLKSATLVNPPKYNATGLVYEGFSTTGLGGAINIKNNTIGTVSLPLTGPQNSGSVYAAFLVKITSEAVSNNGEYFFTLVNGASNFLTRVFVKNDGTNLFFGLNKTTIGATTTYTNNSYAYGTTYLMVVKYTFNSESKTDDVAALYINPSFNSKTEPTPDLVNNFGNDVKEINGLALIQKGPNTPSALIDHIVVAKNWTDLVPNKK